nr:P27 family phage terminase small subunit [Virgibacillus halodenitrificans]
MEQALYTGTKFKEDPATKSDPVAHKEFLRLKKLYKNIEFVDGLDQSTINRYCQLKSQESMLQDLYTGIKEAMDSSENITKKMNWYEDMKEVIAKQNQVRDKMLKLEDRLFLNPVARMRSIPKKPDNKKEKSPMEQFMERKQNAAR